MKRLLQNIDNNPSIRMRITHRGGLDESAVLPSRGNMQMRVAGKKNIVNLDDILYLKSAKNYTVFRMRNGHELISSKTLRIFEEELEGVLNFVRPHRSFMVNFNYIHGLRLDCRGGEIFLNENEEVIEISRRKAAGFRRKYRRYLAANGENEIFSYRLQSKQK